MKIVNVNIDKLGFSKSYLLLLNGGLKLTSKELDVLSLLIDKYLQFKELGLKEPFLSKYIFSSEIKKEVRDKSGINSQYFQNIVSKLVKKKVLIAMGNGLYEFLPHIIPVKEICFKFG